jgi:hypothetical protein
MRVKNSTIKKGMQGKPNWVERNSAHCLQKCWHCFTEVLFKEKQA